MTAVAMPHVERADNLKPEEVLVLANRASPDSMNVVRYYMKQRRIPEQNLFTIEYQDFGKEDPDDLNPKWMPFAEFRMPAFLPPEAFLAKERVA